MNYTSLFTAFVVISGFWLNSYKFKLMNKNNLESTPYKIFPWQKNHILSKSKPSWLIIHLASSLIQILLDIQSENSWLPKEALGRISDKLDVPLARIQHIATFYKAFSLVPKGRHKVHICMGTACHVRGASRILDTVEEATGLKPGETDLDLKFSLETVNCLGCCALGPVMEVDGKVHGKMSPVKTAEAITTYE